MTLYVNDAELIRRIGCGENRGRLLLKLLAQRTGFPQKEKAFGNRRYWPAVVAWFNDKHQMRPSQESYDETDQAGRTGNSRTRVRPPKDVLGPLLEAATGRREARVSVYDAARLAGERLDKSN